MTTETARYTPTTSHKQHPLNEILNAHAVTFALYR